MLVVESAKHFSVDRPKGLGVHLRGSLPSVLIIPRKNLSLFLPTSFATSTTAAAAAVQLLRALLWLLAGNEAGAGDGGGGGDPGAGEEEVLEIASQLAAHQESSPSSSSSRHEGAQGLFARHFTDLLACVVGDATTAAAAAAGEAGGAVAGAGGDGGWGKGSRRRGGFEALLRSAPRAVGEHLGEVMPIFRGLLHDANRWGQDRQIFLFSCMPTPCFVVGTDGK